MKRGDWPIHCQPPQYHYYSARMRPISFCGICNHSRNDWCPSGYLASNSVCQRVIVASSRPISRNNSTHFSLFITSLLILYLLCLIHPGELPSPKPILKYEVIVRSTAILTEYSAHIFHQYGPGQLLGRKQLWATIDCVVRLCATKQLLVWCEI